MPRRVRTSPAEGSLPWVPLYHERLYTTTGDLSALEFGIYMRWYLRSFQPGVLPADLASLARIGGVSTKTLRGSFDRLSQFLSGVPNGYVIAETEVIKADQTKYRNAQKAKALAKQGHAAAVPEGTDPAQPLEVPRRPIRHGRVQNSTEEPYSDTVPDREIETLTEHPSFSRQDPPAAPAFLLDEDDDARTDVAAVVRDREPGLPPAADRDGLVGATEDAVGPGRIFVPAAGSADRRDGGGGGRAHEAPDARSGPRADAALADALTPAQAAREIARVLLDAPGAEMPKLEYASAVYRATRTLPDSDAVATLGYAVWQYYPTEFQLLNPRDEPERQRIRRLR